MNEELLKRIEALEGRLKNLEADTTIPLEVDVALTSRLGKTFHKTSSLPTGFTDAPLAAITAPSGGATVDSQARTAINSVITALENLGLVIPN